MQKKAIPPTALFLPATTYNSSGNFLILIKYVADCVRIMDKLEKRILCMKVWAGHSKPRLIDDK